MRKLIFIPLLFLSILLSAGTYYVSTGGNDSWIGSFAAPWRTWGKGFSTAVAGDTVYFRGGIYYHTVTTGAGYTSFNTGTAANWICFFGYPADLATGNYPILDCNNVNPSARNLNTAIRRTNLQYTHFFGLTIRNVWQVDNNDEVSAWWIGGKNCIIENCRTYNCHGIGIQILTGDYTGDISENFYVTNCDAWNCCDSLTSPTPGNDGTGFFTGQQSTASTIYFKQCRAWLCGDQGFADLSRGYVAHDSCWAFRNGMMEGRGSGYKMSWIYEVSIGKVNRSYTNCVAAFNKSAGFNSNDNNILSPSIELYNCTSYRNGWQGGSVGEYLKYGFYLFNTASTDPYELQRVLRNNIAYNNEVGDVMIRSGALYTHSNNAKGDGVWDLPSVSINANDFVSLDSAGITAARQADGSLPNNACYNTFLTLSNTSDAIDVGTNVGLPFRNYAPDIGAFEHDTIMPPAIPSMNTINPVAFSTSARVGGNLINDGGLTITAKGVTWAYHVDPDMTDNVIPCGSGSADFITTITGLLPGTTYHVRAYAVNSEGPGYGKDEPFTTTRFAYVFKGNKLVVKGDTIVYVK